MSSPNSMDTNQSGPLFKYSTLPTRRSIRLIQLKSRPETTWSSLSISMTITRLDKAPEFNALSYTWGNPLTPFSDGDSSRVMDSVRRYPIDIDGHSILVTANLIEALQTLGDHSVSLGTASLRYLWIDSICINQDDLEERAAQVSIMDTIFETATNVVVWSGKEDEFTYDAFNMILILSQIPRQRHSEIKLADWYDQGNALARVGIHDFITPYMWCGLVAFLNRPLFSRVWVVQEVSLAKNALLLCGRNVLPWSMLSNTISFLTTTGWHDQISADYMKTYESLIKNPGPYRKLLDSHATVGMAAVYLEATRTGMASIGHKALFRHAIHVHRVCKATDPRDMIYALLGIAWQDRPPFTTHPGAIVPDYTISVQELYTKVARTMLQSYGDLRFLSHVQDSSSTLIENLPSWVPDYSAELRPAPLTIRATSWKASRDLKWVDAPNSVLVGQLPVAGILLDRIANVVTATTDRHDMRGSAATDSFWQEAFRIAAQIKPKGPHRSRFDIFWRTILADTYGGQHPAPASFAQTFFDYVIRAKARIFVSEEAQDPNRDQYPTLPKRWVELTLAWQAILKYEPSGSPFCVEEFEDQFAAAIDRELTAGPDSNYWTLFIGFEQELRYTQNVRRVFCTQGGYFGCGAETLAVDDEVWILGGADTPMVLRKLPSGGYRLIGEAYVHGVMHGEAVVSVTQAQLQKIVVE